MHHAEYISQQKLHLQHIKNVSININISIILKHISHKKKISVNNILTNNTNQMTNEE